MPDNLGFNWGAYSFGNLLDLWDTIDLVDNMALLDWYWGLFNNWVVQAVLRYDFVARRGDGLFVSSICNWSSNWCVESESISESVSVECFRISFTFGNNVSGDTSSTVFASNFLAYLFVFDGLSNDLLGLTDGLGSWGANLGLDLFMFNCAVWCKNWGNSGNWGNRSVMVA